MRNLRGIRRHVNPNVQKLRRVGILRYSNKMVGVDCWPGGNRFERVCESVSLRSYRSSDILLPFLAPNRLTTVVEHSVFSEEPNNDGRNLVFDICAKGFQMLLNASVMLR